MAVSQNVLDLVEIFDVRCPACGAKLEIKSDESALRCIACHRAYPIRDGIPSLLVEEATIEDEAAESNAK